MLNIQSHIGTDFMVACVPSAKFDSLDCSDTYFYM